MSAPIYSWRELVKVHPAAEVYEMLPDDAMRELVEDVSKNGLLNTITVKGKFLVDGRNRLEAVWRANGGEQDDKSEAVAAIQAAVANAGKLPSSANVEGYVASLNAHRRHLTYPQKLDAAKRLLELNPNWSDRIIAKRTGLSPTTAGRVRSTVHAGQLEPRTGADGKTRKMPGPSRSPTASQESVLPSEGLQESVLPSEGLHDPALPANNPGVYEELIAAWDLTTTTEQARFIQERIAVLDSVAEARRLVEQFSQAEHAAFAAWFEHRLSSSAVVPEVATAPESIAAPIPATPEPEPTSDAPSASDEPPAVPPRAQEMFNMWSGLKQNTRGRLVKWIEDDCPAEYPTIDNIGSMKDSARPFRELVSRTIDETAIEAFLKLTRGEQAVQW